MDILPNELTSLILNELDEESVLSFMLLSTSYKTLTKDYLSTRLQRYLGYIPTNLARYFRAYRQVGTPHLYHDGVVTTASIARRDVRKFVTHRGNLVYIDLENRCYHVEGDHAIPIGHALDLGLLQLDDTKFTVRLTHDSVVIGEKYNVNVHGQQLVGCIFYGNQANLVLYYLTKERELMAYTFHDKKSTVVYRDVKSSFIYGKHVHVVTPNNMGYASLQNGTAKFISTMWSLDAIANIVKYVDTSSCEAFLTSSVEETTIWDIYLLLPAKLIKDIVCPFPYSKLLLLYHGGKLTELDVETMKERQLDTHVISMHSYGDGYVSYIRHPFL